VHAHEVATLGARSAFTAATPLVLAATGRALVAGRFWRRRLYRGVKGTTRVPGLATLRTTASTAAAAATSIAAALTLTLALTLALTRRRWSVRRGARAWSGVTNLWSWTGIADAGARR